MDSEALWLSIDTECWRIERVVKNLVHLARIALRIWYRRLLEIGDNTEVPPWRELAVRQRFSRRSAAKPCKATRALPEVILLPLSSTLMQFRGEVDPDCVALVRSVLGVFSDWKRRLGCNEH